MKKLPVLLFLSVLALSTFSANTTFSKKGRTRKNPIPKQQIATVVEKDKKVDSPEQAPQTTEIIKDSDRGNGGMFKHQWSYGPDEPMDFISIKTPEGNYAQHILLDKSDQKDVDHTGMINVELWVDDYLLKGWVEKYLYDKGYYDYLKPKDEELFITYTNNESSSDIISRLKEEANETSGEMDNVEMESQDNNETFEEVENDLINEGDQKVDESIILDKE